MQRTKSKILSILLSLVMLLSLLPTTALAAGTYPESVALYNGNKQPIGLSDGQYLAKNNATKASDGYTDGTSYVARYVKSTGTLYLKGYKGVGENGGITAARDLNIVVESDSSFTTSRTASNDSLMGIQATGKLDISGDGKLTVSATGNGNVYGISAKEGVTISTPLDVTAKESDATKNGLVYGIYTTSGVISLSDNDKTITATGGKFTAYGVYNAANSSTAIPGNGNINISGKLTVHLENGKSNIGIYKDSGGTITLNDATVNIPGNFEIGIYNNNGNVDIKNHSDVTLCSDKSGRYGIWAKWGGNLTIENSTVKVSAKDYAADLEKGKLSIKDSIVDLTLDYDNYRVVNTANDAANTIDLSGSGSVTLTASGKQTSAMIGGKVSITSGTKKVKGEYFDSYQNYDGAYDAASNKTVLQFVHEAPAPATYTVSFNANGGTGTMADVTGVSGEYTLPANGFTAPAGKQFKAWSVGGVEKAAGDKITVTANTTVTAVWEAIEYNVTVTGGTASVGAGTPITKATMGTTVTLTAGAAPTGKVFDKWEVVSGGITLADANSETTTFTMPASAVSVKATYKTTPVTTYNLTTQVNGGHGTISASKTGLTAGSTEMITFNPEVGYEIDTVTVNGTATSVSGNTLNVTMNENKTVVVTYKAVEYNITVTDGKATIGAGTPITKATMGTTVTLTAGAAPSGKVFDKWEVVSGGITLADANSSTTTFTMPASAVSVKATYKTKPVTTYNLTTSVNGGHGTISAGENGITEGTSKIITFTPDSGYEIDKVMVNGTETTVTGNTLTVTMDGNKNVVVTYKAIEYTITVTDGKATIGAGSEISKAAQGTIVTLTANAASSGKEFDKWEVVSGGITLADANSATTTFTMPASAVSVKATYKNAPHTHTYNQETVKPEALKTPADCTSNAVYFKSCSCGAISTTDTFVAMDTALGHAYGSDWKYDSTNHWHECSRCHDKKEEAAHDYGSDNVCDTCGYDKTVPHTHNLTLVAAKAATCTAAGNSAYYTCDGCDKWFADATGSVEITDKTSVKIPAPGHTAGTEWKSDDTNHWHECTVAGCGVIIESTKSAHTAGEWIVDTPATATTAGTKHKECTVCGYTMTTETIPATGGGGGGGGSYTPSYTVSVDKTENGTITVSPKSASKGDTVTVTVKPDKGYELDTLKVLDKNGDKVKLTEKNGKYTFTMPTGKVTVKGSFVEEAPVQIFKDVPVDAYCYEAVKWAAEKGITGGIGNGLFGPNDPCTRAQIVTFLWRAAGSPAPKHMSSFADVPADAFYAKAVAWAVENGITGGTGDGKFSPDATCTRAQSVTFLYRAAGSPKVSGSAEFGDVATNAYYADAVAWAAKNGITGGIGGGLFGSGNDCTRAQIVTFLYRSVK